MSGSLPIRRALEETLNMPEDRAEVIARKIAAITTGALSTESAVEKSMGVTAFAELNQDAKKRLLYRIDLHLMLQEMSTLQKK